MTKDKAILPISYFGPVRFFQLLNSHKCQIEQHENYQKRTIRNRTNILSANGVLTLSVPLQKGKTNSPIKLTKISYDEPWQRLHLKSIRSAYSSAPYFDYYYDEISNILNQEFLTLFDLDIATIGLAKEAGLISELAFTEKFERNLSNDVLDMRAVNVWSSSAVRPYNQVFEDKYGFIADLSLLDALFNLGPEAARLLYE